MGTEPFAHFHLLADEGELGIAVCEMTLAGAHQHMGAQMQLLYTVGYVFGAWGDAADFETAAQFDTGSTACLGMFGGASRVRTDLYFHTFPFSSEG
jgi:hypothetical protein